MLVRHIASYNASHTASHTVSHTTGHTASLTTSHTELRRQPHRQGRPQHHQPHRRTQRWSLSRTAARLTMARRQQPDDAAQGDQGPRGALQQAAGHPKGAGRPARLPASSRMGHGPDGWRELTHETPLDGWQVVVVFDGKQNEEAAQTELDGGHMRVGVTVGPGIGPVATKP